MSAAPVPLVLTGRSLRELARDLDLERLTLVPGLVIPTEFRYGSGLTRFPKRMHKGRTPSHYGYLIRCADISAYCRLLERLAEEHPGAM
ncbi:hypothetical protein DKM19_10200 [Streptosporangium sp. 'caverna']|nr:hypothetical protein DKM19_10200 [Streptosporangium sp. 'caverna']